VQNTIEINELRRILMQGKKEEGFTGYLLLGDKL
jgi:hypothetical protein